LVRCHVDERGTIYFCAASITPSIFNFDMQQGAPKPGQAQERAKSINEIYVENRFELFSMYSGDRMDTSFAARLMTHWADLEHREPSAKIVCRNYSEKPQPGIRLTPPQNGVFR
jgi:hypothetical protein